MTLFAIDVVLLVVNAVVAGVMALTLWRRWQAGADLGAGPGILALALFLVIVQLQAIFGR